MKILGIRIDNLSKKEILEKIEFFLDEARFHHIATVNPEFILEAQRDKKFKDILSGADLNIADGAGIWFAFLRNFKFLRARMAGADLMFEILKIAEKNNLSIFLASYKGALSGWKETKKAILEIYPGLKINGVDLDKKTSQYKLPMLDNSIVFCSLGVPFQEKFIHSLKSLNQGKIRLAMGVGGSFDFLTGKRKRAPKIFQKLGLEWLWRFLGEPRRRAKRIWNAVIIFPIKIILKNY